MRNKVFENIAYGAGSTATGVAVAVALAGVTGVSAVPLAVPLLGGLAGLAAMYGVGGSHASEIRK